MRKDGLFRHRDALLQMIQGQGPVGFLALGGYAQALIEAYFPDEMDKLKELARKKMSKAHHEPTDARRLLLRQPKMDRRLDYEFFEEIRVIILFQVLIMVASEARLRREAVLFQKFLRENRFKLMSNGINPPADVFRTKSFASIDVPLVAVWLTSLSAEERDRFHLLKSNFSEDVAARDIIVDQEDARARQYSSELAAARGRREAAMAAKRYADFAARRQRRIEAGNDIGGQDEAWVNALELVQEVESGWSCRPGKNDRALQFYDHEFPADDSSLGEVSCVQEVVGWRVASAINPEAVLFEGGTDPDDVMQGKLNNAWFLSAVNIVAASGGVGDDEVDELIDRLFVNKETSFVGGYGVQFYKNNQWETVLVDDYFPVLHHSYQDTDSRGAAFGFSKGFQELWVPLLEKAYAKYHGSYAAIEEGTVPMALKDLTGGESEEIFLAKASRGANKKALWNKLKRYYRNKYLLGAGSMSAATADREIQDTGLVFGAAYAVYEVREIDGHQMLKLRNPPGDHEEWKGDWSDSSPLWTKRLKFKLGFTEEDDNTFWMSFDDFCNAFRSVYVCRYYDPDKWITQIENGKWDAATDTASGITSRHNLGCLLEMNPQWVLNVQRPTDYCITLTQVDQYGTIRLDPWPAVLYVVRGRQLAKAELVRQLSTSNVVMSTGPPAQQSEVKCFVSLDPGLYTILAATYLKNMEGQFMVTVVSNYPCTIDPLWPAVVKEEREPFTLKEKLAAKAKQTRAKAEHMALRARQRLDAEIKVMAEGEAKSDDEDEKPAVWVKRHDKAKNQDYYFNSETGQAVWEKPLDYKDPVAKKKKEIKGDVCSLCASDRVKGKGPRTDVVKCKGKCGVQVHEGCHTFTDTNPAGRFWLCDNCREAGVIPDAED